MAGVLLRPVWPVARREEGASPAVGLRPTSNEATGQTGRTPTGGSPFRSRLRCSLLTDPLRDMLVARASPGPKNLAAKHQPFRRHNTSVPTWTRTFHCRGSFFMLPGFLVLPCVTKWE